MDATASRVGWIRAKDRGKVQSRRMDVVENIKNNIQLTSSELKKSSIFYALSILVNFTLHRSLALIQRSREAVAYIQSSQQ
jgi:hypothetical protein